jgi:hypothetical protein
MKRLFIPLLPVIMLYGALTADATAQNSVTSQPSSVFAGWDASKPKSTDVAVTAIIQEIGSSHASGTPAGLNLMLGTPQGVIDASVGPYLAPDIRQALVAGKQIQVIGQVTTINDQSYLLVRQLVLNGKSIIVRNDHGSLVRTRSNGHAVTKSYLNSQNGGTK